MIVRKFQSSWNLLLPIVLSILVGIYLPLVFYGQQIPSIAIIIACAILFVTLSSVILCGVVYKGKFNLYYLFLMIFLMDASFRTNDLNTLSIDWQSGLKMLLWLGAFIVSLSRIRSISREIFSQKFIFLTVYIIWAIVSTVYSVTPVYTFGASIGLLGAFLFSVLICRENSKKDILNTLAFGLGSFLITSWLYYLMSPEKASVSYWSINGYITRLTGISGQPNVLGREAALFICTIYLLGYLGYQPWHKLILPFLLGVATLFFTQSRVEILSLLIAYVGVNVKAKKGVKPVLLIFFILINFSFIYFFFSNEETLLRFSRSGVISEIYTFTGRTEIWDYVIKKWSISPLVGYGYASSRIVIPQGYQSEYGFTTSSSHNLFLQSLLTLGIIGTVFLLIHFTKQIIDFFSRNDRVRDLFLIIVLITGIFEVSAIGPVANTLTIIWVISINLPPVVDSYKQGLLCRKGNH